MKRDRGEYRPIYEVLLDGPDWQRLPADARLVFLALKIRCGVLGIKIVPGLVESLSQWTGLPSRRVQAATKVLEESSWIQRDGSVVWVVRGLEFEPSLDASNANHRKHIARVLDALPTLPIVERFRARYSQWVGEGHADAMPMASPIPMAITTTTTTTTTKSPSTERPEIAAFLALVPPERRPGWEATLANWREGVGYSQGRVAHDADIAQGLTEYLASTTAPDFSPRHVVRFVEAAERRRTQAPRAAAVDDATGRELSYLERVARGLHVPEERSA